jgi:hypothetical protein
MRLVIWINDRKAGECCCSDEPVRGQAGFRLQAVGIARGASGRNFDDNHEAKDMNSAHGVHSTGADTANIVPRSGCDRCLMTSRKSWMMEVKKQMGDTNQSEEGKRQDMNMHGVELLHVDAGGWRCGQPGDLLTGQARGT